MDKLLSKPIEGIQTLLAEELAPLLHMSKPTLIRKAKDGSVPAFKCGRHWIFETSKIKDWMETQSQQCRERAESLTTTINKVTRQCHTATPTVQNKPPAHAYAVSTRDLETLLGRPIHPKKKNE